MITRIEEVAKLVDMDGYLQSTTYQLSGGQKQRVSLAGVMVDQVEILLFDEPLANLDPATGKYSIDLIDRIQQETDKTIVIIEHRLEDVLYRHVDRIIVIDEGRIISDSSPDQLLSTSILEETYIREPLYLKAVKYAGCDITPEMKPAQLSTFAVDSCKEKLIQWFESVPTPKPLDEIKPILELKEVSFKYTPEKHTIQGGSLLPSQKGRWSVL